jgi:ubiquinone biosynthesis monooxygenase Coq7
MSPTSSPDALRRTTPLDRLLAGAGRAMAAIAAAPGASRPSPRPAGPTPAEALTEPERRLAGALMRVNHVGEVCAQALYEGQAATTSDPRLERFFREAAAEEGDHLAWTRERIAELGARPSLLNPFWYAGAFAFGALAGRLGDRFSLGFMVETERQVERHLAGHLERLPAGDAASRAIVEGMKADEAGHADHAQALGAAPMPEPIRVAMRVAARVMTETAHRI